MFKTFQTVAEPEFRIRSGTHKPQCMYYPKNKYKYSKVSHLQYPEGKNQMFKG